MTGVTDWPVDIDPVYGCHLWRGLVSRGYPVYRGRSAARVAYERKHGALPTHLEPDHLCRRPRCVRTEHLEAVTRNENERRKSWARRVKRARCPASHELYEFGRRTPEGGFVCLRCCGLK